MQDYELIIAEKPNLGRDIASALGGGTSRGEYIQGDGWIVTWTVGHLLELWSPEEYDEKNKIWSKENLPLIPDPFKLKRNKAGKSQIPVIDKLSKKARVIVNAGDADREGQMLVDEVIDHIGWNGPEERIWFNELTPSGIRKSYKEKGPNSKYRGKSEAGHCRSQSDWLIGMNFSPLFSLLYQSKNGKRLTLNTGRVMTPVLNLVVARDRAIENFKPKDFYELFADFSLGTEEYKGKWQIPEDYLDPDGYLTNKSIADRVAGEVMDKMGEVISANYSQAKSAAPMPYTLTSLQIEANKKFGMTADQVLKIAQALYSTYKMTSYPRTEVAYMSTEQHSKAPGILEKVFGFNGMGKALDGANWKFKHPVFNDKKLGEHYAIIPTGVNKYSSLSEEEKKIYDLVSMRFLAVFYPPKLTDKLAVETEVEGHLFKSNFSEVVDPGWEALYGKTLADEKPLPQIEEGMAPEVVEVSSESKKTSPPKPFTEASLLDAMKNIAKYVEDEEAKKTLKENSGLGTPATRGELLKKLKRIKFLKTVRGKLRSTDAGRECIDNMDPDVTSPVLTANWEDELSRVESGEVTSKQYMDNLKSWLTGIIDKYIDGITVSGGGRAGGGKPSAKQIEFAQNLAEKHNAELDEETLASGKKLSEFIDKYYKKPSGGKKGARSGATKPPSAKQISFAEKLADEKNKKLPAKYKTDWKVCSAFIDKCLGK